MRTPSLLSRFLPTRRAAPLDQRGPDFLCIGAQKAGTGWVYDQLLRHPDFWMPPIKELHYFDDPATFARRVNPRAKRKRLRLHERWPPDDRDRAFFRAARALGTTDEIDPDCYAALFAPKGEQLSGDITPAYSTLTENLVARISRRFRSLKVLFLVRDPVERLWSQYCMAWRRGRLKLDDPLDPEGVIGFAERPEVDLRSRPTATIARWRAYVPEDRFSVFFFDDLRERPEALRCEILRFLAADPQASSRVPPRLNRKSAQTRLEMSGDIRRRLALHFRSELERCAEQIGGPAARWPERYGL